MSKIIRKNFNELTTYELYEIFKARVEVFVVEQNCVYSEVDDVDYDSIHLYTIDESGEEPYKITSYLRIYKKADEDNVYRFGRVLTTRRGEGLGGEILNEAVRIVRDELKASEVYIEAQSYALGFYEKVGFVVCSEEFLDEGIPHKQMRLKFT